MRKFLALALLALAFASGFATVWLLTAPRVHAVGAPVAAVR
jgi:hypothetical protein